MYTMTFLFIDQDGAHASKAVVTAETKEECIEKYFLKHPDRKDSPTLQMLDGDWKDIHFELVEKDNYDRESLQKDM